MNLFGIYFAFNNLSSAYAYIEDKTMDLSKLSYRMKHSSFKLWLSEKSLFLLSLLGLGWFICRTGMRPTRIIYPCQKAAIAPMTSYLVYFFSLIGFKKWFRVFEKKVMFYQIQKNAQKGLLGLIVLGCIFITLNQSILLGDRNAVTPSRDHGVVGLMAASGISTGASFQLFSDHRVVSVHDTRATDWDYSTEHHWQYVDQDIVSDMVLKGVKTLTQTNTTEAAWSTLIPYQNGEAVAIKVNCNNCWAYSDVDGHLDALPETVNAVISGLISIGVPQDKIWVTDPSRIISDRFREKILYNDIRYFSEISTGNRPNVYITTYVDANSSDASPIHNPAGEVCRPAQVFVDADHIINIPMLKGHDPSWITLGLKNHYGSVFFKNADRRSAMHTYIYPNSADPNSNPLGDINNNPHIRDKTRLILGDALFGDPLTNWSRPPVAWQIFDNVSPNMLFFGVDPIAIESVMLDYLDAELVALGRNPVNDDYLHYAANIGLGVHEHWDDFSTKNYSTIEYVQIENEPSSDINEKPSHQQPDQFALEQNYPNPFNSQTVIAYEISQTSHVLIKIYNVLGKEIATLIDDQKQLGFHRVRWNGNDLKGNKVQSGIYYYRIITDSHTAVRKMILIE